MYPKSRLVNDLNSPLEPAPLPLFPRAEVMLRICGYSRPEGFAQQDISYGNALDVNAK